MLNMGEQNQVFYAINILKYLLKLITNIGLQNMQTRKNKMGSLKHNFLQQYNK